MFKAFTLIFVFCLLLAAVGASSPSLNIPVTLPNGLSGSVGIFGPGAERGDLEVGVAPAMINGQTVVGIGLRSRSGRSLDITNVSLRVLVPAAAIDGVWTPSGRIADDRLISADAGADFVTYSAANYGIPYLAAANSSGQNLFAMGLLAQDLPAQLRAAPAPNGLSEFQLTADVPKNRTTVNYQFFVSNEPSYSWFDVAEKYADWVDAGTNYSPFPISGRSFMPVYDTWYWSQDQVDDSLYLQTGEAASAAGLGIFLADSGWDAPTGEYNKWLDGSTGNYMPPPEKFRDLSSTFDTLRSAFNLKVQLWLQPFAVGRTSMRYPQTKALHTQVPKPSNSAALAPFLLPAGPNTLEDVNLCPQTAGTHQYLRDLFTEMASLYRPDGYWLDFIDGMSPMCVAQHRHDFDTFGDGLRGALSAIRDTILNNDPDAIVHFRAQYANLNNKPFSNVWQPFDSPNNFDRMRLDALRLRPFSKGVVFAADELYWPETVDDRTVARFVMTDVMTGVPSIGANLVDSRPSSIGIIKAWMDFYKKYQADLTSGQFRPLGSFRVPNHRIESDNRIFVYIRSKGRVRFPVGSQKEVFLMNASDLSRINSSINVGTIARYDMQAYDRYLQPQGASTEIISNSQGIIDVNAVVQRGGMLVLRPLD